MANVSNGKKLLAAAILACLITVLLAVPAYAFFYVHGTDNVDGSDSKGAMEVVCTLDETAVGGTYTTDPWVFIPNGGTVADVLEEAVHSSESQNGLKAIHNYDVQSLKDYLAGKNYTVSVYEAFSQKPGTHTTYDSDGAKADESTTVNRFDNVVITVKK